MKCKIIKVISLLLIAIFLTSCWDYGNIERRAYLLGLSIDKANSVGSTNTMESMAVESGTPKYSYGIQMPILGRAQNRPSSQGGGGSSGVIKTWNLQLHGNSMFEINREYSTRLDYVPHYSHLQAIIISEAVARDGIVEPLDFFLREPAIRIRTKIYITPTEAFGAFGIIPKVTDYSAIYLRNLTELGKGRTARMVTETDLGRVSRSFHSGRAFMLPKVIYNTEEAKIAGAAVFKDGKMLGWLDELRVAYARYISNSAKSGSIVINDPSKKDREIALEVKSIETKVTPIVNGDEIKFKLKCKAKVHIAERSSPTVDDFFSNSSIKKVEQLAEEHVKKQVEYTIKYVQDEFGVDIFQFYDVLSRKEPKTWDKVKKNWDETIFRNVSVEVSADVSIDEIGNLK